METAELEATMQSLGTFVRSRFEIPDNDPEFTDDVHLFDYGYVDSFGAVELTSFVEKGYCISVAPSDLVSYPLNTIREIATFIVGRRNKEI